MHRPPSHFHPSNHVSVSLRGGAQLLPTGSWLMKHEGRMEGLQDRVNQEVWEGQAALGSFSRMDEAWAMT